MENKTVAEVIEVMSKPGGCVCSMIAKYLGRKDESDKDCDTMNCHDCYSKWFGIFAEMVEREKAEAVSAAMERTMAEQMAERAVESGLPAFNYGEDFGQWLKRCFLQRPLFEDGEPVQFGDEPYFLETIDEIAFFQDGSVTIGHDGNTFEVKPGERAKRPIQKVLDTQERLNKDKAKLFYDYWNCRDCDGCDICPSKFGARKPHEHYGVQSCAIAQGMDIARRQRELDARKGGAE